MKRFDNTNLDRNALKAFLALFEERSVSRAAERLNVSQSGLSHTLGNLRIAFDDPLFERIGRGVEPTARARRLLPKIASLLDGYKSLNHTRSFDPREEPMRFSIVTNDFPLHLIFPSLLIELADEGIRPDFRFVPAGVPSTHSTRTSEYQMIITPAPPNDSNMRKHTLFKSKMEVYYDAAVRKPPNSRKEYLESSSVEVRFSDTESSMMVMPNSDLNGLNEPAVTVPNFSSLTAFIKGTDRITTQLGAMQKGLLSKLDKAPLPVKTEPIALYMAWHKRDNDDPANSWLRDRIIKKVNDLME